MANNSIQQIAKRAGEMHSAEMCRICLQQKDLVHIAANHRLTWYFSQIHPSDDEFPQFACAVCQQLIDVLYQFTVLGNLTANLIRSYVKEGRNYPRTEMIEDELRRAEDSLQQSGRESAGKRSETIENDTVNKGSEKQPKRSDEVIRIAKPKPARKQSKDYLRSDEFLFGGIVDFEQEEKIDKFSEPRKRIPLFQHQDNKENIPPTCDHVKIRNPSSTQLLATSVQRFRSLSHRENSRHLKANEPGQQLRGEARHISSKVSDKR